MSADLPEMHRNAHRMARALVTYIADPRAVQQAVAESMGQTIGLHIIRDMRKKHESGKRKPREAVRACDGHYPAWEREQAERVNSEFLKALKLERERSAVARLLA